MMNEPNLILSALLASNKNLIVMNIFPGDEEKKIPAAK